MEDVICLVPDALAFSLSGLGPIFFAKRKQDGKYETVYATVSLIHGGIENIGFGVMNEKEIKEFTKILPEPYGAKLVTGELEKLKEYLFGAYAYYTSLDIPEFTSKDNEQMKKALSVIGDDFGNKEVWLKRFTARDNLMGHELIDFMKTHDDIMTEGDFKETMVLVNINLRVSNPGECVNNLLESKDFLVSEQNSKNVSIDMVKLYKFDKNDPSDVIWQKAQKLIKEGKSGKELNEFLQGKVAENNEGKETSGKVYTKNLMLDGDSAYKKLGGLKIWRDGRVNISTYSISTAGIAVYKLLNAGALDAKLSNAEYSHWEEALMSKEKRKKRTEVSRFVSEATDLLNLRTEEADEKGIALLNKALESDPNDYDSLYMICDVLISKGNTDVGKTFVERLLNVAPDDMQAHLWKTQVLMDAGLESSDRAKLNEAMQEAEKARSLDNKSFDAVAMCAQLSYFLHQRKHAIFVNEMKEIDKERAKRFMDEYFIY